MQGIAGCFAVRSAGCADDLSMVFADLSGRAVQLARFPAVRLYEHFVVGPDSPVSPSGRAGDPGWCGPGSASWEVFGDPSALVAVFAAMLMQAGSPVISDAFNRHGTYDVSPERRYWLTGGFYFATTYGSHEEAESWIARARRGHRGVTGRGVDGKEVSAAHRDVMRLSHLSVLEATLRAWEQFGPRRLPLHVQDRFVAEQAWQAARLGVRDIPRDVAELRDALSEVSAEFPVASPAGAASVDSILSGRGLPWQVRGLYAAITAGARVVLPPEHRALWGLEGSTVDRAAAVAFVEGARVSVGELSVVRAARHRVAAGSAPSWSLPVEGPVALTWPALNVGEEALGALLGGSLSPSGWLWLRDCWGPDGPRQGRIAPLCDVRALEEAGVVRVDGRLTVRGAAAAALLAARRDGWDRVYRAAQRTRGQR